MKIFIRSLYIDLRNKIDKMILSLEQISMERAVASTFKSKTRDALITLRDELNRTILSGTLEIDVFLRNNIIKYNSFYYEFIEIELFRYLVIINYKDSAEGFFEKVIDKIYNEIDCLQSVPFISTISNSDSYYWAYPKYNMIALPQGEEKNLMNLSDLYHEIGHLIFQQSKSYLVNNHVSNINVVYDSSINYIKDNGLPHSFIKDINESLKFWENSWSEEIACDLIATILVGPAYAWTNLKIATISVNSCGIYSENQILEIDNTRDNCIFRTHPPDETRMRAIFKMLEITGYGNELIEIRKAWNSFLEKNICRKSDNYDFIFPDELVDTITDNVLNGCNAISLRSYSEQFSKFDNPVSKIINDAWQLIRSNPDSFSTWEEESLKGLSNSSV